MTDRARRGRLAEQAAVDDLRRIGLTILDRNVRVGRLEIDIIAREGPVIAVVEVRTRGASSWQRAMDSVNAAKQRRVRTAGAILWSRRYGRMPGVERMRFDIVSVDLDSAEQPVVEYVRGAF